MGSFATIACAAALLLLSPQVMQAAADAAEVFVHGVMPALFPMMILNGLSRDKAASILSKRRGFRAATTVLLSFMAGSPASAQRVARELHEGRLLPHELLPVLAASGVMSPMFFLGTLAGRTGLRQSCAMMLLAHWLSALVVGLFLWLWQRAGMRGHAAKPQAPASRCCEAGLQAVRHSPNQTLKTSNLASALPSAIRSAVSALLSVCGAMMLFSVLACVIRALPAFLFPAFVQANSRAFAVLWALLEVGGGAYAVLDAFPAPPLKLLCALCSFSGLSICLQNLLFLGEYIRPAKLLLVRVLHGAAAYVISSALLALPFRSFP